MNPRTPRRRISPQTRRRCKAIKGFFKRALGSVSQPDLLQITSSIAVNVTDINHKIVGLEQHLSEVCKQCRDQHRESQSELSGRTTPTQSREEGAHREEPQPTELNRKETNVIYTKSQNRLRKSTESDYTSTTNNESNKMNDDYDNERNLKLKKKKSKTGDKQNEHNNHKTESAYKTFVSSYSTSSFHSLDNFRDMYYPTAGYSGYEEQKRNRTKSQNDHYTSKTYRDPFPERYEHPREEKPEKLTKKKKSKHNSAELDPDFIADIIKRQYKPVKFGRRHSDLSQFSTPVCRDYEFCRNTDYNIPEERESCKCGGRHCHRRTLYSDCSDARSMCDARLYHAKRTRPKHRKRQADARDDSEIYDLVPVKEKSSPKSRRKFMEDNMRCSYYKEVPPSPRSHRPQLNLKTRYAESDCDEDIGKNYGKRISKHAMRTREMEENYHQPLNRNKIISPKSVTQYRENGELEENYELSKSRGGQRRKDLNDQQADAQPENCLVNGHYPTLPTEDPTATIETPLNKTQETEASDKTDKALCEIKDILQSFLLEIKKEASSHTEKSTGTKMSESGNSPPPNDAGVMTNHGHSFSNFNSAHCPVAPPPFLPPTLPAFGNPCCYPVMPMCPINCNACLQNSNCMQNRYPMASASFTCNNCYDRSNDTCNLYTKNTHKSDAANEPLTCETDELIKEIYKFVSQSPTFSRKDTGAKVVSRTKKESRNDIKVLTSRSAGGSTRLRRHDAKVGTAKLNCASKSCEAIGAKLSTDAYSSDTSVSYSDTMLEKLSLETTQSNSETELSTEISQANKVRKSRFSKVLNSLGLRKKMKSEVIEELSESESAVVMDVKKRPPYRQNVTNCMMYGQEYYRPPPVSPHYRPDYVRGHQTPYNPDDPYRDPRMQQSASHGSPHPLYHPRDYPSAPPYSQSYDGYSTPMQPQVPLCLKEVEVKSIGCQSERKLSFFRKFTHKVHQPSEGTAGEPQRNGATQTQTASTKPAPLFNWKPSIAKDKNKLETFGYETQKKLALGDVKMRNAMLKKMFYKRNPFSPRNLIIKTLMGKDKSSYGNPPAVLRPKMFF